MAPLMYCTQVTGTTRRPAQVSQLRKLAPSVKVITPRFTPLSRPLASGAVVEAPTAPANGSRRSALYLLHRHLPNSTTDLQNGNISQEHLHQLHGDLKAMEKIAKRAVWFSAVEANDGEHILLLTDCPKLGLKYDLQSMPADVDNFSFNLPGRSVVVPLEEVSAALLAQSAIEAKESLDEEMEIKMKTVQGEEKAAKQRRKELEKAAKALAKAANKAKMDSSLDQDGVYKEESDSDDNESKATKKAAKAGLQKDKKKDKEQSKMMKKEKKDVMAKNEDEESSGEEKSDSGSDSEDESVQQRMDVVGPPQKTASDDKAIAIPQDCTDSDSDESGSGSSDDDEEGAIAPRAVIEGQAAPVALQKTKAVVGKEESESSEDEEESSSGSESEQSDVETEVVVGKALDGGEIPALEA